MGVSSTRWRAGRAVAVAIPRDPGRDLRTNVVRMESFLNADQMRSKSCCAAR